MNKHLSCKILKYVKTEIAEILFIANKILNLILIFKIPDLTNLILLTLNSNFLVAILQIQTSTGSVASLGSNGSGSLSSSSVSISPPSVPPL